MSFSPSNQIPFLLANSTLPTYDTAYPLGDRPGATARAVYDAILASRTKTFDPEKVATGSGTLGDPWNPTQAQTLIVPGDIVAILPGVFTGVDPVSNRNITPAFYPKVTGTEGNPIIYIAENPAVYETADLSEFRSGATVLGSGWPAFGTKSTTDIRYMGVYSNNNVATNKAATDSATASFRLDSHRCNVSFSELIGNSGQTDNYSAVRVETSNNCRVYNNKLHGYTGFTNNSGVILYKSNGFEASNNEIYDCTHGIQTKDSTTGDPTQDLWGVSLHHNLIYNVTHGFRFHAPIKGPLGELSHVYQNIVHSATYFTGLTSAAQTTGEQNGLMIYNNVGFGLSGGAVSLGFDYQSEGVVPRDNRFFNNIFEDLGSYLYTELVVVSNVPYFSEYAAYSTNCIFNYNAFANGDNSGTLDSLTPSAWAATYGQDSASVYADPDFENTITKDFHLKLSSPCLTTGVDLLGKFGSVNSSIPMGAYVSGVEEIGIQDVSPSGGSPDKLLDFGSVANGADLSSDFSYWGQKGTSYGTEGDTSIFPPGSTSSAKMSIQKGSDGLSEFSTNGTFGGGVNDTDGWNLGEGDELYTGIWMYIPVGFNWRTNTTAVKFLRHNYVGKTTKLDVQILHSGNADQQGWKILNEEFPQAEANDARNTSVIMEEGEWSFITFYTYFHSDPNLAIVRLSKGQEFIYERSGTNLKFRNSSGNIQTDTVLGLPTLHDSATKFAGTMIYTYWNGGNTTHSGTYPIQDQQVNMKSFGFKLSGSGIFDDQGNEVLDEGVF